MNMNQNLQSQALEKQPDYSKLAVIVTRKGKRNQIAKEGDEVTVHYTGWLQDGTKFDSSLDRLQPFSFTIGAHQVIEGWEQGVLGMQIAERRELYIPSELGYGRYGFPPVIPENANLKFEVELLAVKKSALSQR
jgi:peptidylprolyl isomerase/FKBP-type peptidyl-prolyl cis-trans isomerase FkpA